MVRNKEQSSEQVRSEILQAAEQRFSQYGYGKTTMTEIAKDCAMSAANIYRYFDNKLEIAATLCCQCLDTQVDQLETIVAQNQRSAASRLEEFIISLLHLVHTQWAENPRMDEMVNAVCFERGDIVNQHVQKNQALIVKLIEEGNRLGEFDIADPHRSAEAVFTTMTLFVVPLLMPLFPLPQLEYKAKEVVKLILTGLQKR